MDLALLEDDLGEAGVIEPYAVVGSAVAPERIVLCFFSEIIEKIAEREDARLVENIMWAHGAHSLYEIEHRGERLGVLHPGVGAPLAAGMLEDAIALGGRRFVAIGGAGALVPDLTMGHAIVVSSALRDEGTSFHYEPSARTIDTPPALVSTLESTLTDAGVPFVTGRAWTTDAPYRETRARVTRRVEQDGCVAVEMEASALLAVAAYRGVSLVPFLYAGDSLAGDEWDHRGWNDAHDVREGLFWLAADTALRL